VEELSSASLIWLGQAGFKLIINDITLLIDPYLSNSLSKKYAGKLFEHKRMMAPPIALENIGSCDFYLCTHSHTDHMDPETIEAVKRVSVPQFIFPRHEVKIAEQRGIPVSGYGGINAGEILKLSDQVSVMAIPASHETIVTNANAEYKFLGYVIFTDGLVIYHSGDCVPYPGQADLLRSLDVNVALLPVNGRDDYRLKNGVPGNFTAEEAVDLCREAGIRTLIPHHWGMFEFNTIDPNAVPEFVAGSSPEIRIPVPGEAIQVSYRGAVVA
jgi:L-ascorbate metabolism protein UlaG (beta-lactamase superfamily)